VALRPKPRWGNRPLRLLGSVCNYKRRTETVSGATPLREACAATAADA